MLRQLDVDSISIQLPENPLANIDLSTPSSTNDPYQLTIDRLEGFFVNPKETSADPNFALSVMQDAHKEWLAANVDYVASDEQQRAFERLSSQLDQYAKKLQQLEASEVDIRLVANTPSQGTKSLMHPSHSSNSAKAG